MDAAEQARPHDHADHRGDPRLRVQAVAQAPDTSAILKKGIASSIRPECPIG
jgi:hypothetical protein